MILEGRSFLWHQVRTMVGAASDVCRGARTIEDIKMALEGEQNTLQLVNQNSLPSYK